MKKSRVAVTQEQLKDFEAMKQLSVEIRDRHRKRRNKSHLKCCKRLVDQYDEHIFVCIVREREVFHKE